MRRAAKEYHIKGMAEWKRKKWFYAHLQTMNKNII